MTQSNDSNRKLYVGMHAGVCAVASSDGGETWQQGNVTPTPNAAARLSASTSVPGRAFLAAYEAGVYRTDDGGGSWRHLSSYPTDYAHSVLVHPDDGDQVYVGSEPAAVFRSQDGGATWEEHLSFQAVPESTKWFFHAETRDSHVRELRMAPNNPEAIYAGIEVGGMVRSLDGGSTWRQLEGIHDDIHFVNLSPTHPERLYIATAEAPYRSDDQGNHWEKINDGLDRRYTLHINSAPDDADLVLVTVSSSAGRNNPQFYRSEDGGRQWTLVNGLGSDDDMVVAIDWDSAHPGRVYAGTDAGKIFYSNDRGKSWTQLPVSLPNIAISSLIVAPN